MAERTMARREDTAYQQGDIRPIPDPSRLTMDALASAVDNLKETQRRDRETLEKLFDKQFAAYDKALALVQSERDKEPSAAVLQETLLKLADVTDQRFVSFEKAVEQRFDAVNLRFADSTRNVNDTMLAYKSSVEDTNKSNAIAIGKSEAATTKAIDNLGVFANTLGKALDDKIADTKDRLSTFETRLTSFESRGKGADAVWGYIVGAIGIVIAIATLAIAALVAMKGQ